MINKKQVRQQELENMIREKFAQIGNERQRSYMRSILGAGERFRESAVHIQRWWAMNMKGEAEYGDVAEKINALVEAGDAESIVEWATILQKLIK